MRYVMAQKSDEVRNWQDSIGKLEKPYSILYT